jgi:2-C-methyl-D-erythritol 4-phosphate cytidylyltransferase
MVLRSLLVLESCPRVKHIVVVAGKDNQSGISALVRSGNIRKVCCVVRGGRRRQDSVSAGLAQVPEQDRLVLIHDAARPFIDRSIVEKVIARASRTKAAICAVPAKATIKEVGSGMYVARTFQRSRLWEVQTPQAFDKDLLLRAHKRFARTDVTDDASLVERMKKPVAVVMGSYANIKITTPEDAVFARALVSR